MTQRIAARQLADFARALLLAAGMPADKAQAVSTVLVEGDLMGHTTHGLQLLAPYLAEIEKGSMNVQGEPEVLSDKPAALLWDGRRLPGPWLVLRAIEHATQRAREAGTGTVVIRRGHHIASLASYHRRVAEQGLVLLLACSDANSASVAPFGGLDPVFTPNPISAGIPTGGLPVSVDISTSTTTNGLTNRLHQQGGKLPAPWLIDGHGQPSNDPAVTTISLETTPLRAGRRALTRTRARAGSRWRAHDQPGLTAMHTGLGVTPRFEVLGDPVFSL